MGRSPAVHLQHQRLQVSSTEPLGEYVQKVRNSYVPYDPLYRALNHRLLDIPGRQEYEGLLARTTRPWTDF